MNTLYQNSVLFLSYPAPSENSGAIKESLNLLSEFISTCILYKYFISEEDSNIAYEFIGGDLISFYKDYISKGHYNGIYTANDMASFAYNFLSNSPKIEDLISAVIVEGALQQTPPNIFSNWPTQIQENFFNLLCRISSEEKLDDLIIFANYQGQAPSIQVTGYINEILHYNAQIESFSPPRTITKDYRLEKSALNLYRLLDPLKFWNAAENIADIKKSVYIRAKQLDPALEFDSFYIGSDFIASLKANSAWSNGPHAANVLEKSARTLAKVLSADDFRVEEKKSSPCRTRHSDSAKAKRVQLNTGNPAFRLMFWELLDGKIELANIGPKKEYYIAQGEFEERF